MLYRGADCGIYDNNTEPSTIVWFSASSRENARTKLIDFLAATWGVEHWQVYIGSLSDELEILRDSLTPASAGDRRLHEVGSIGEIPMYDDFANTLVFLDARSRARLYRAWADARRHAADCAEGIAREIARLTAEGNERVAESLRYDLERHRRLAAMLPGNDPQHPVGDSNATAAGGYHAVRNSELLKIAGLLELAGQQRSRGKARAANDNAAEAQDRLARLVASLPRFS